MAASSLFTFEYDVTTQMYYLPQKSLYYDPVTDLYLFSPSFYLYLFFEIEKDTLI